MTNAKLKKIDDHIQSLRREGVSLYQFGTRRQRAGLWLMGLAMMLIGGIIGAFIS